MNLIYRNVTNKKDMNIKISKISALEEELVEIHCHKIDDRVNEIISFVKSRQGQLSGSINEKLYEISITDVYYIESVDNRTFIYTSNQVYETKEKLYELENMLTQKHFLRVSKSILLNLMKIKSIKPALNGRFTANLQNKEEIIISRKYVPSLKATLQGGNVR